MVGGFQRSATMGKGDGGFVATRGIVRAIARPAEAMRERGQGAGLQRRLGRLSLSERA